MLFRSTALNDLVAGRLQLMFPDQNSAAPLIRGGKLRLLAVTGIDRSRLFPDAPTMQESGFKGFTINVWSGVYGPAAMSSAIVERLNGAIDMALKDPALQDKLNATGNVIAYLAPAEFARFGQAELDIWKREIGRAHV